MLTFKYGSVIIAILIVGYLLFYDQAGSFCAPEYAYTKIVLQEAYNGEIQAHRKYLAFNKKAMLENYSNIAYLFKSLANSESIHAQNFKKAAAELNIKMLEPGEIPFEVSSTKENLKNAVEVEMYEVDDKYPNFINTLEKENGKAAVRYTTFAWKTEMQHKDVIKKIRTYIDPYFKEVAKRIENNRVEYFICQNCGSTATEVPTKECPTCGGETSGYKKIDQA